MKLTKSSTIVFILFSMLCLSGHSQEAVQSDSFQRVKQELWAFGPTSQPLVKSDQQARDQESLDREHAQSPDQEYVPEELTRALIKYSVDL